MLPRSVLFYWSKGANVRREILRIIGECEKKNQSCFLNFLAQKLKVTHVAAKKHLDLLVEEGYVEQINPRGKPVYLQLTHSGREVLKEFSKQ